jgi:hypothetical protein
VTPGARRKALAVLAVCATVAAGVGVFWLTADAVAHLAEVPRG